LYILVQIKCSTTDILKLIICRPDHPKIKSQQWDATRRLRNIALGQRTRRSPLSFSSQKFWQSAHFRHLACARYQRPVTWRQACYAATSAPCHNMARLQLVGASIYATRTNREQAVGPADVTACLVDSWPFCSCHDLEHQVKVKLTLEQATKSQRGSRCMVLLFVARWGGWSTTRPGRFTPGKDAKPIVQWFGRPQGRSGRVRETLAPSGLDPRIVQHVASRSTDWAIPAHRKNETSGKWTWLCHWN